MTVSSRDLRGWLVSTFLGPFTAYAVTVTASVFVIDTHDGLLGGRWSNWGIAMVLAAVAALLQSGTLAAVDLWRLRRGVRLPKGWCAWLSSGGAAVLTMCGWALVPPGQLGDAPLWALAVAVPLVMPAVAVRLIVHRNRRS